MHVHELIGIPLDGGYAALRSPSAPGGDGIDCMFEMGIVFIGYMYFKGYSLGEQQVRVQLVALQPLSESTGT